MDCFVNRLQTILEGTATIVINDDTGKIHFTGRSLLSRKGLKLLHYLIIAQFSLNFNGLAATKKVSIFLSAFSKMPNGIR